MNKLCSCIIAHTHTNVYFRNINTKFYHRKPHILLLTMKCYSRSHINLRITVQIKVFLYLAHKLQKPSPCHVVVVWTLSASKAWCAMLLSAPRASWRKAGSGGQNGWCATSMQTLSQSPCTVPMAIYRVLCACMCFTGYIDRSTIMLRVTRLISPV